MFTVKAISTIVLLGIFAILNVISFSPANDPQGIVFIELIDEYGNLVEYKEIEFEEESNLRKLLEENFEVEFIEYSFGFIVISINDLETDFRNSYISIYVNNTYLTVGIDLIEIRDGYVYSFRKEIL